MASKMTALTINISVPSLWSLIFFSFFSFFHNFNGIAVFIVQQQNINVIFFFVICTSAFEVVDIKGYVKLLAPTTSLSLKGRGQGKGFARKGYKGVKTAPKRPKKQSCKS